MKINESIEKSIEGGFRMEPMPMVYDHTQPKPKEEYDWKVILWEPDFWKCLGKSMGWRDNVVIRHNDSIYERKMSLKEMPEWQHKWHKLIDHLSEGGTPESYFEPIKEERKDDD